MNKLALLSLSWALAVCALLPQRAHAQGVPPRDENRESAPATASYCGLYCVYGAAYWLDKPVDFQFLCKPQFIGSTKGSSISELAHAAESAGLIAEALNNLSVAALRSANFPIILHVRKNNARVYNHWVLYLGDHQGMAVLIDAAEGTRLTNYVDIAQQWDGTGLIVSTAPIDVTTIQSPDRNRAIALGIVVLAGVIFARRLVRAPRAGEARSVASSFYQGVGMVAAIVLVSLTYNVFASDGMLAPGAGEGSLERAFATDFLPRASMQAVEQSMTTSKQSGLVLVDARLPDDYLAGHLPGAINIPPNAKLDKVSGVLSTMAARRVIVYCQSETCPFSTRVADQILAAGYQNISIYPGGWEEWSGKHVAPRENQ